MPENSTNKNKRDPIPNRIVTLLWVRAGGRCEYDGCNQLLYKDDITLKQLNKSHIAHIIAASPNGPRGDSVKSKELQKDISNLMLLCDTHHRLIDDKVHQEEYTIERLTEMKQKHECRIERLTSIHNDKKSLIVTYGANIADNQPLFQYEILKSVIAETHYPAEEYSTDLGLKSIYNEKDPNYWQTETDTLERKVKDLLDRLNNNQNRISHISLFALAPMPLLVKLGTLLPELYDIEVYQRFREPKGWNWQKPTTATVDNPFIINSPTVTSGQPILVLSISAPIRERVYKLYENQSADIWEVTIENPSIDILRYKKQIIYFKDTIRRVFQELKRLYPTSTLNVHMAMPNSCAIEFGRVWMPKADLPLVLFDFFQGEEHETIKISNK